METKSMDFEIVTASEGIICSRKIAGVVLPTTTGLMGVLPGHAGSITTIDPGLVQIQEVDGSTTPILVYNGTAMIRLNTVLVTVDQVEQIGKDFLSLEEAKTISTKVSEKSKTILNDPSKSFAEKQVATKDAVFAASRVSGYLQLQSQGKL
jgi:F-type H+-transporting ATPase subunit epsilon